ncbi:unnamed protein product, partial [Brachionus calyciflorus]
TWNNKFIENKQQQQQEKEKVLLKFMSKNNQHENKFQMLKCKNCVTSSSSNQVAHKNDQVYNDYENMDQQQEILKANNFSKLRNNSTVQNFEPNLVDQQQTANTPNKASCIIDRLNFLYLNENLADVYFFVGKQNDQIERIPAHKLVLSIGSPVFMAMFYGTGSQMQSNKEIEIPDADPISFKNMLKYLYTDELHIEPDSVMNTLYISKKYAIEALERECVDFLKNNLRPENAFMLLEQALLFDESKLAESCLTLIDRNSVDSFSSECFLDIDRKTLILILKRDSLGIREFKLFYYVLKWAQHQCVKQNLLPVDKKNQKVVLGDAINLIRFSLMTKEEFAIAMNDENSRIIDDKSIVDLFINLTLTNSENSYSYVPKILSFNDTPRNCLGGKEQIINRFSQIESRWGYSGTSDRVRFSVNQKIYVLGFGLYGSIYGKCEYQAIIQLIHFDSCKTCAQNSTNFFCDGTKSTFAVYFKEPVQILADTDYIASATLKGPDSYYGTKGLRNITHEVSTGIKLTFNFQYASGNNNGTSVEDGQIPEIIFLYSCS